ncbi:MAG: bifunctional diaminohydroxyphosphoribosylaminopyrimidine deaminase/5-amino-6-(5-phosphoribosylamino)uracil reductase RibD, partial [Tannerella sp.]|nr:bifunctional diaminohydroxyphosphoribosylaminopyrimidine deaminase/5-amino-6-(5-phosphoribosylamino)uracil reductase RibD [Tannerella sp.]
MQMDERYMARCLALAEAGRYHVAPNPMVGAVIVYRDRIIGEGFHRRCGEAHAEVNAIEAVKNKRLLKDATLYVSLEPCSHYGKTPPCTELIIREGIRRVVVGSLDPFSEVSGRGIRMLQDAGAEVVAGVLEEEAVRLNRFFMTAHIRHRPYVILKWAQSADGFIDRVRTGGFVPPVQFSTPVTRRHLHKLRSEVSAIMVGTNTAVLDNPSLTVRHWVGNSPVRILLDRSLRVPPSHHLLDGTVQTCVFTEKTAGNRKNVEYIRMDFSKLLIQQILKFLFERKINALLVEGGASLHESFLESGLFDEIRIETSPVLLNGGIKAPGIQS